jgi:hypothetical protein
MRAASRITTPLCMSAVVVFIACGGSSSSQTPNSFGNSSSGGGLQDSTTNTQNSEDGGGGYSSSSGGGNNSSSSSSGSGSDTGACMAQCSVDSDCQTACPAAPSGSSNCCMGGACYMAMGTECPAGSDGGTDQ